MFRGFIVFLLCNSFPLFGNSPHSFQFIDLGNLSAEQNKYFEYAGLYSLKNTFHAEFNGAPEIGDFIQILKSEHQIDVAIETGTFLGETTLFFSACFDEVHTIEISNDYYQIATESLKYCPNVHCHFGSSEKVLHEILPDLKEKKVLFYLDAHWNEYWPLLKELEEISQTHRDHCIIVIDDFKVPGRRDIDYDHYGSNECSYFYIKQKLNQIYTKYDYYYLIPKNLSSRAKFVAIPKNWPGNGICEQLSKVWFLKPFGKRKYSSSVGF
jgi:predicted O-methyltransferase YrrM